MAAHKTPHTMAVEQFKCPACEAAVGTHCINSKGGRAAFHKARVELLCAETFLGLPMEVGGWPMFCSRRAGHKSRHRTSDARLEWARDLEPIDAGDLKQAMGAVA